MSRLHLFTEETDTGFQEPTNRLYRPKRLRPESSRVTFYFHGPEKPIRGCYWERDGGIVRVERFSDNYTPCGLSPCGQLGIDKLHVDVRVEL